MTSYLYAPKDDCKHRAFWRELYTVEEAEHLQSLITAAHESNVDFFYAISPGLDITYSNSKEIATLKRKLDQVAQLGCKSFALLFDDIEAEMSKPDKEAFQSFAHAQVSITNEIYQHLGQPNFLFCPTQYCTARAVPTIATSEYLKTIGAKLALDIDIMWTGDKVIPKDITVTSLQSITQVLKRPPVIWDNEHANDYDQRRIYLGPYSGRSPDIIPKLRGVLTNPNCEYGANFVAIHSLAAWSKCTVDGCSSLSRNDAVSADIKLELGTLGGGGGGGESSEEVVVPPPPPDKLPPHVYHPRIALKLAISEWIVEFTKSRPVWGPITKPQVGLNPTGILQPSVNTCLTSTTTTSSINSLLPLSSVVNSNPPSPKLAAAVVETPSVAGVAAAISATTTAVADVPATAASPSTLIINNFGPILNPSLLCPGATPLLPVMNSLVSTHEVVMERPGHEVGSPVTDGKSVVPPEPMETNLDPDGENGGVISAETSPTSKQTDEVMESNTNPPTPASIMQVEPPDGGGGIISSCSLSKAESTTMLCEPTTPEREEERAKKEEEERIDDPDAITEYDLELFCDLFYLPCEHGPKAIEILTEFYWLKTHAGVNLASGAETETEVEKSEWERRREQFNSLVRDIKKAFDRLCLSENRELVYNLYTYVWDLVGVLFQLKSYIDWLALGHFSPKYKQLIIGRHTWFSGIREAFLSGDHEPWVFRGGLTADLQRLMPVDSGNDLFMYLFPDHPTNLIYKIRPFKPEDEEDCYRISLQTWEDGMDATDFYTSHPRLVGEKSIGPFIHFYSSLGFVFVNNNEEIVGYIFAAPNMAELYQRISVAWLPEMRAKYSRVEPSEGELLTPCEATINSLHGSEPTVPTGLESPETYAVLRLAHLPSVSDSSLTRRAAMLILACLRTSGVLRAIAEVPKKEKYIQELYTKIGFTVLAEAPCDATGENLHLTRGY